MDDLVARVAVFGDVHADLAALRAVLADAQSVGIERFWCLGDFAFTVYNPKNRPPAAAECFDLTMSHAEVVLAGNHEWFRSRGTEHEFVQRNPFLFPENDDLGEERLVQIRALEPYHLLADLGVELVHGSLTEPRVDFVQTTDDACRCLALASQPIVLCGHTHKAAHFQELSPGIIESVGIRVGERRQIHPRAVLNPGAGRDGPTHCRWMQLELEPNRTEAIWHRAAVET